MKLTPEIIKNRIKWIKALRSGRYKQTNGKLCRISDGKLSYCCLGVACNVLKFKKVKYDKFIVFEGNAHDLNEVKRSKLGMTETMMDRLIGMNDRDKASFKQIAAYLQKTWNITDSMITT